MLFKKTLAPHITYKATTDKQPTETRHITDTPMVGNKCAEEQLQHTKQLQANYM